MTMDYYQQDYRNFDPWPLIKKIGGILLIVTAIAWLKIYNDPLLQLAKLLFILAGFVRNFALQSPIKGNYLQIPLWRTKKYWFFTVLSVLLTIVGLTLMIVIEPLTLGIGIHFVAGSIALLIGGNLITVRSAPTQIGKIIQDERNKKQE